MKRKKVKIALALLIFISLVVIPTSVFGYRYHSYKIDLQHAETLLNSGQYDNSISAYRNLKSNKFSDHDIATIDSNIKLASELKLSKQAFDSAVTLCDQKKYIESIDSFKNVKDFDKERYNHAQEKIKEASQLYITDNLTKAKNEAASGHYDNAIPILDNILKFDQNSEEATNLKNTYNNEIQKIKDEEIARKQAEEEAKKEAENKAKKKAEQASKTTNTNSNTSQINASITSESDTNIIRIYDNGAKITVQLMTMCDSQLNLVYYSVIATSTSGPSLYNALSLNYTATFTSNGVEVKDSSTTQDGPRTKRSVYLKVFNGGFAKIDVTYKGQVFTLTGNLSN